MEICSFGIAKKLKEKGFKEKCIWHYYDDTKDKYQSSSPQCYNYGGNTSDAPTTSQVLKWLRKKGWYIEITYKTLLPTLKGEWTVVVKPIRGIGNRVIKKGCESWEEASVAGIEYIIDNLI